MDARVFIEFFDESLPLETRCAPVKTKIFSAFTPLELHRKEDFHEIESEQALRENEQLVSHVHSFPNDNEEELKLGSVLEYSWDVACNNINLINCLDQG